MPFSFLSRCIILQTEDYRLIDIDDPGYNVVVDARVTPQKPIRDQLGINV